MRKPLRNWHAECPFLFRVGIADVVPKSIAYRLLAPALAATLQGEFPQLLDRAPLLRWLHAAKIHPRLVGEFDDRALMKAFGQAGAGVFAAPSAIAAEVAAQYGVVAVGATEAVRERFFLITVERRISHPAARVVSEAARSGLFTAAAPLSG